MERRLAPFFLGAFAWTWACQMPGLLAHIGLIRGPTERFLPLIGLGSLGPLLSAVVGSSGRFGGDGNRALFRRFITPKVSAGWYLLAPIVSGALLTLGLAACELLARIDVGPWFYPPRAPERIVAMVVFSIGEEVGWRGYALPRLRDRYGALPAGLLLGAIWGVWHIPMFVMAGLAPSMMLLLIVGFLPAGSVVFSWFFEKTGGNLTIAVLLHMGAHLNNSHLALPTYPLPTYAHTLAYALFALSLVLGDRGLWQQRRQPSPPR